MAGYVLCACVYVLALVCICVCVCVFKREGVFRLVAAKPPIRSPLLNPSLFLPHVLLSPVLQRTSEAQRPCSTRPSRGPQKQTSQDLHPQPLLKHCTHARALLPTPLPPPSPNPSPPLALQGGAQRPRSARQVHAYPVPVPVVALAHATRLGARCVAQAEEAAPVSVLVSPCAWGPKQAPPPCHAPCMHARAHAHTHTCTHIHTAASAVYAHGPIQHCVQVTPIRPSMHMLARLPSCVLATGTDLPPAATHAPAHLAPATVHAHTGKRTHAGTQAEALASGASAPVLSAHTRKRAPRGTRAGAGALLPVRQSTSVRPLALCTPPESYPDRMHKLASVVHSRNLHPAIAHAPASVAHACNPHQSACTRPAPPCPPLDWRVWEQSGVPTWDPPVV